MDKIIDKISAYNIFTNLFPGVIYCLLVDKLYGIPLVQQDIVLGLFLYYFAGMVISRISSLVVEPLLKKTKFVKFADYGSYIAASAKDEQIGILLETSNSYRSVIALLICVIATGAWSGFFSACSGVQAYEPHLLIALMLMLFLFSYRKQTRFVVARIEAHRDATASKS